MAAIFSRKRAMLQEKLVFPPNLRAVHEEQNVSSVHHYDDGIMRHVCGINRAFSHWARHSHHGQIGASNHDDNMSHYLPSWGVDSVCCTGCQFESRSAPKASGDQAKTAAAITACQHTGSATEGVREVTCEK